jgi:alkylation response protein AidB-like acyl-CoA dehydrogenase
MDLMQTADQDAIQQTVRGFLAKELPMERVRELGSAGVPALAGIWRRAAELGFFALGLPESAAGAGYDLTEEMILFEELGRSLAPGPWLGTVLAAHALGGKSGGEFAAWRHRLLTGDLAVALIERPPVASARRAEERLDGEWKAVIDGNGAAAFLVLLGDEAIFVPADAPGVTVEPRPSMDPTRSLVDVRLRGARAIALSADQGAASRLRCEGTVLACAEAVGGIQRTVEMSVEYGKVRHQFGKPIGSFQAVKHRCSDMAVRAEVARSAAIYATVSVRDAAADAAFQASVAKILCANAYIQNAADNVQNHGGMGFTWECDAHLFVKRARGFDQTLGARWRHLDGIVDRFRTGA